ncbi:MAG: T9SS type A sorting domain-containing protein [Balneola sp.]
MYISGDIGDDVNEYHLSTGFNVSTASFVQTFSVSSEESSIEGVTFSPGGAKMFIVGSGGDEVNEYHLEDATPPTLSSAVFTSATQLTVTFSEAVAALGNNPGDFTLTDGASTTFTVMGIADATPGDSELELTVADVNAASGALTLTYTNNNGEVTDYNNNALASDGTGVTLSPLVTLSSGYKESDTSIQLGFSAPVQTNGGNPGDFTVTDAHGTTFAVSAQSDGVAGDYYINLTTADLSVALWPLTVTYNNNNGEISDMLGAQVLSHTTGVSISNASGGFDISEATFTQLFSVSSQEIDPFGITFNPSGSKMFIIGLEGADVNEYSLNTGFDISTASFVQTFSVSGQTLAPSDVTFNKDGTKMYVTALSSDSDAAIYEYSLSIGFDVSTASYAQVFTVHSQEISPTGIAFNASGSKMFVVGRNEDAVVEYSLSSHFDVSTASYVQEYSVDGEDTNPTGVVFNSNGTKMYISGNNGSDINEYHLSTGFDVSSASFVQSFSIYNEELSIKGLTFSPDGTKMFIVGSHGDEVNEYYLGDATAPTLSSAIFSSATQLTVTFSEAVITKNANPEDFTLTDSASTTFAVTGIADATPGDGELELTVANVSTAFGSLFLTYTNNNDEVTDYNNNALVTDSSGVSPDLLPMLSSGYKESDTSLQLGFSAPVQTNGGNPGDFTVTDAHGTTFAVSAQSDGVAGDYYINLTTADLSTALWPLTVTYNNNNGEISNLSGALALSTTGVIIANNSVGFDIAYAFFEQHYSVNSQDRNPTGIAFNPSGSKMFIVGGFDKVIIEYSLMEGFDVSTAIYKQLVNIYELQKEIEDISFSNDGTKMFVLARVYDYESSVYKTEVHEYNLNMAFDISTSSYEQQSSVNSAESDPTGITFDSSGGKMFIVGNDKDAVVEYNLSSNFDISTMTYVGEFSVNSQETSPKGVAFNSDGTKMYITGNASDDVNEYHLSTGFNVSTASFEQSFSVSTEELSAQGLTFNPDGTKMFIVGSIGDEVNEYHIKESTPPTLSSAVFTSATQLNVTFSEAVAAYGNNPGDFTLTDGASTTFAVTGIADATPGDSKLELTVADVIAASGALTLTYTNNNGEVTDYNNNALASDGTGVTTEFAQPIAENVSLAGTMKFWEPIAGSYSYSGWTDESGSTYQWYRSEDSEGTGKTLISGATDSTYTPQVEDIGKYLSMEVTPSDGTETGDAVESSLFGPVENMRVDTLTITGNEGWRMMSSPGDGASFDSLLYGIWTQGFTGANTTNGSPNVLLWDETTRSWSAPNDAADVPAPGVGFLVYVFDDDDYNGEGDGFPKVLDTNHYQNLGETTPSLSFTNTDSLAGDGWNLVGNPYATPLDWDAGNGWTRTNVDNTVYVWSDSANSGTGAYLTWNNLTGTLSDGIISPWQGFWVKANAAAPVITFTDSVRSTTDAVYLKQAPASELRLTLAGNGKSNQAIIMFGDGASLAKDPLDAYKLVPLKAGFLSVGTSLKKQSAVMDIQALPAVVEENIELGVSIDGNDLNGEFTLSWASPSLPEGWNVYLMDRKREQITDMKSEEAYTFSLEGPVYKQGEEINAMALLPRPKLLQAEPEQRFTLVVTNGQVLTNEWFRDFPTEVELNQNYPNPFNPSTTIQFGLPEQSAVSLEVFDILGRKVATLLNKETRTAGRHSIRFDGRALASGVYLYRLRAGKSVIIKKLTLIK